MTTPTREQVVQWAVTSGLHSVQFSDEEYVQWLRQIMFFATLARADLEAQLAERDAEIDLLKQVEANLCNLHNVALDQLTAAKAEIAHWKNNHATEVRRARILKERTDMPIERVQAYEQWGKDQAEIAALKTRLELDDSHRIDGISARDETIRLQDEQIAAAQAEIAALKEQVEKVTRYWQVAEGRCDALKEDAERYRWLRVQYWTEWEEVYWCMTPDNTPDTIDTAIDKARKEK